MTATALLAACGSSVTASDAGEQAEIDLAQGLAGVHERALNERAADPAAVDAAAAGRLGYAVSGGNTTNLVSATVTPEGVEVVTMIGVRAQVGGGHFYHQATLGACLLTHATAGSRAGDVGEQGTVTTEAVPCPDGFVPVVDSVPVEATTMELQALSTRVPRPDPAPCLSGSSDCVGG